MSAVLALLGKGKVAGRWLPGLALTLAIAVIALLLREIPGLSVLTPLSLAVLLGITIGNACALPASVQAGVVFAGRRILRLAIMLLGFQLSAMQIVAVGLDSLFIVGSVVAITFITTCWMGSLLGVDRKLAELIAAGTSICGASAVVAMNSVSRSHEEDVIYAVGSVTVFGTILMFVLPACAHELGLDARDFGIWAGASIHEIAQVTGAALQFSKEAGEAGVVVKLTRVLMLAPLILICGLWLRDRKQADHGSTSPPAFPLFVLGFLAAAVLNSVVPLPDDARASLTTVTAFLMSMALAALGLQTDFRKLKAKGIRPLVLGALATLLIVGLSLGLLFARTLVQSD